MNNIKCPLCKEKNFKYMSSFKEGIYHYFISICKTCGLVLQNPRQNSFVHNNFIRTNNMNSYHKKQLTDEQYAEHCYNRSWYISDFLRFNDVFFYKKDLLEIGSHRGGLLNAFKNNSALFIDPKRLTGVESDERLADYGRSKYGVNIITEDWMKMQVKKKLKKYDIVLLPHVLEHFSNPVIALTKVYSILRNGGYAYIELPSFHWEKVHSKPIWQPEHLTYFSQTTLSECIRQAGLHIIMMHESRYWGNIKVVVQKDTTKKVSDIPIRENYIKSLLTFYLNHLLYPFYNMVPKRRITAND